MTAGKVDLFIERGATFSKTIKYVKGDTGVPVDLTGYAGYMQIRDAPNGNLIYTVPSGDIFIDVALGTIQVSIPMTATATMEAGEHSYDLVIKKSSYSRRLIEGKANVSEWVTKNAV